MRTLRKPFQHTQSLVIKEVKEQLQEDVITYMEGYTPPFTFTDEEKQSITEDVCDIIVDKFKRLEDK
jgi:hypothetical protein